MSNFNAESTTDEVIAGHSLAGKQAVVTGASTGLGLETVRVLAAAGARVLMLARDDGKLQDARQSILAAQPDAQLETALMDLSDLDSVRRAAAAIVEQYPRIDLLINNAGVMCCPLGRTAQGFELQFGTNHLGHFLFTGLLAPAVIAAAPARIVVLSSAGHKMAQANLEDPNYMSREYQKWQAYGESKTANALFATGLDERLKSLGVRAFSVHPGVIITELGRHLEPEDYTALAASQPEGRELVYKSIPQGAATSVWAATSEDLEGKGGIYLEDCQIAEPAVAGGDGGVESYAVDADIARRLWDLSEDLVGEAFTFTP
ncbi:MAG: SDR family NAD(P)-dependent oxidoreductase [Halioglobus sp.]